MTEEELQAIEARANAATPGPWTWRDLVPRDGHPASYDELRSPAKPEEAIVETDSECYGPRGADAEFIAHAREDIPALVAEVRRLRSICRDAAPIMETLIAVSEAEYGRVRHDHTVLEKLKAM